MEETHEEEIQFSPLGRRMASGSGIEDLMDDLGRTLAHSDGSIAMLGGGNPAPIPEGQKLWRERMAALLSEESSFDRMLGHYDPHHGNRRFIEALANLFNREYGWNLKPENIAITNGGQTAFFFLFNLLGDRDGKILFPLSPEYIGYSAQGIEPSTLLSIPGRIEKLAEPFFRYRVDFEALPTEMPIRAACVSRPTNPTGNVLCRADLERLHSYCRERQALLIIDNAYGTPFPNMIFREEEPFWREGVVLTYSLSKLGLPGTRTGIVIGPETVCRAVSSMTAVVGLANGTIGQALTLPFFEDGSIIRYCKEVVRPYYETRSQKAVEIIRETFTGISYRIHEPDGALFLWLWFPDLKIHSQELYEKLKDAGVLVVPGHLFFHNLSDEWPHASQCIRINYSMDIEAFPEAMVKIANVLRSPGVSAS